MTNPSLRRSFIIIDLLQIPPPLSRSHENIIGDTSNEEKVIVKKEYIIILIVFAIICSVYSCYMAKDFLNLERQLSMLDESGFETYSTFGTPYQHQG